MARLFLWKGLLVGLCVALAAGAEVPARAEYTKLYVFPNRTTASQLYARVITNGLEIITAQCAEPTGWVPARIDHQLISGVFCTRAIFGGLPVRVGDSVVIGFRTSDNSCRLRDLSWSTAAGSKLAPVSDPVQTGGMPGGGEMDFSGPHGGGEPYAKWWITNDTGERIKLSRVEFITLAQRGLDWDNLREVAVSGIAGQQVLDIERDLAALGQKVLDAQAARLIPGPAADSLLAKLRNTATAAEAGLVDSRAGRAKQALAHWREAAKHLESFISELRNRSPKGNAPDSLCRAWTSDAQGIIAKLGGLAAIQPLSATGVAPSELLPGDQFFVPIWDVFGRGDAAVLTGQVFDSAGNPVVQWVEQDVYTVPFEDGDAPIVRCTVTPPLSEADSTPVPVTVTLNVIDYGWSGLVGLWVAVVPEGGQEETPAQRIDPSQLPHVLTLQEPGTYRVVYSALDNAGNASTEKAQLVRIDPASVNLPPPPVRMRAVRDRGGDNGGAIDLDWTWYRPPSDFHHYSIYRDTSAFSDISALVPLPIQTGSVLFCTDATTTDGTDYYYAVTCVDAAGNEDPSVTCVGPVRSVDNWPGPPAPITTLVARDHPADTGGVIDLAWIGYPPVGDFAHYSIYRGTASFSDVSGMTPLATPPTGWDTRWYTDRTTTDGTDYYYAVTGVDKLGHEDPSVTCVGPVRSGANSPISVVTDPAGDVPAGYGHLDIVRAWVDNLTGVSVRFNLELAGPVPETADAYIAYVWHLDIDQDLTHGAGRDTDRSERRIRFSYDSDPDSEFYGWRSFVEFIPEGAQGWPSTTVAGNRISADVPITQEMDFLGNGWVQLPHTIDPDGAFNWWAEAFEMAPGGHNYRAWDGAPDSGLATVSLPPTGLSRAIAGSGSGIVTAVSALSTRDGGADIVFTLSAPATVEARVLNLAGREVGAITTRQVKGSGLTRLHWNGRSASGARVPSGRYLVCVAARTADGRQSRGIAPLMLQR